MLLKTLLLSSLIVNIGIFLGRLTGFMREVLTASTYGVGNEADAVVLIFTVPDLLANILMGGAMGAVLVPEFAKNIENTRRLLCQAMLIFGCVFVLISCVFHYGAGLFIQLVAPGFSEDTHQQTVEMFEIAVWLLPLTILAGVVTAYLQHENRFAVFSLGTLIVNVSVITGLILTNNGYGDVTLLAVFVLIGGGARLLSQLAMIPISSFSVMSLQPWLLDKEVYLKYAQAMLSGSAIFLMPIVARAVATNGGVGSLSTLNYSLKLVEFPLAVLISSIAVVFFPKISKTYIKADDVREHAKLIATGLRLSIAMSVLVSIALFMLSSEYASLVYGYGEMDESNIEKVRRLTVIGLIGLPFQGCAVFLSAVLFARGRAMFPAYINLVGLVLFLFLVNLEFIQVSLLRVVVSMQVSYVVVSLLAGYGLWKSEYNEFRQLLSRVFLLRLLVSSLFSLGALMLVTQLEYSIVMKMCFGVLIGLLSLLIAVVSPSLPLFKNMRVINKC